MLASLTMDNFYLSCYARCEEIQNTGRHMQTSGKVTETNGRSQVNQVYLNIVH